MKKDLSSFYKDVEPSSDYKYVLSEINCFLDKICTDIIHEYDSIEWTPCIEQKYLTDMGKLFVCNVRPQGTEMYKNVILRACIPAEGFPVQITCFGDEKTFNDKSSLENYLWKNALKNEDLVEFLRALKSINTLWEDS